MSSHVPAVTEVVLDNDPYCTKELASAAEVEFEPRHVIQIYEER